MERLASGVGGGSTDGTSSSSTSDGTSDTGGGSDSTSEGVAYSDRNLYQANERVEASGDSSSTPEVDSAPSGGGYIPGSPSDPSYDPQPAPDPAPTPEPSPTPTPPSQAGLSPAPNPQPGRDVPLAEGPGGQTTPVDTTIGPPIDEADRQAASPVDTGDIRDTITDRSGGDISGGSGGGGPPGGPSIIGAGPQVEGPGGQTVDLDAPAPAPTPADFGISDEAADQAVGGWIADNSDLVTTGADDPTKGPFTTEDIEVRRNDEGRLVVGPTEAAFRDRQQSSVGARVDSLLGPGNPGYEQAVERRRQEAQAQVNERVNSLFGPGNPDYEQAVERRQQQAAEGVAYSDRQLFEAAAETEQLGDINWTETWLDVGEGLALFDAPENVDGDPVEEAIDETTAGWAGQIDAWGEETGAFLRSGASPLGVGFAAPDSNVGADVVEGAFQLGSDAARAPSYALEGVEAGAFLGSAAVDRYGSIASGETSGEEAVEDNLQATNAVLDTFGADPLFDVEEDAPTEVSEYERRAATAGRLTQRAGEGLFTQAATNPEEIGGELLAGFGVGTVFGGAARAARAGRLGDVARREARIFRQGLADERAMAGGGWGDNVIDASDLWDDSPDGGTGDVVDVDAVEPDGDQLMLVKERQLVADDPDLMEQRRDEFLESVVERRVGDRDRTEAVEETAQQAADEATSTVGGEGLFGEAAAGSVFGAVGAAEQAAAQTQAQQFETGTQLEDTMFATDGLLGLGLGQETQLGQQAAGVEAGLTTGLGVFQTPTFAGPEASTTVGTTVSEPTPTTTVFQTPMEPPRSRARLRLDDEGRDERDPFGMDELLPESPLFTNPIASVWPASGDEDFGPFW